MSIAFEFTSNFLLLTGTWPVVFGQLKGGEHWVRLLFVNLFLLGIDSAFSILEAPMCVAVDYCHKQNLKVSKWQITTVFVAAAYLCSLIYATDAGLFFLDSVDFYINFCLLLIGFFESFGAGWIYGIEEQIQELGSSIVFTYMFTNFGSVIIACCLWFGLDNDAEVYAGFIALIGCYMLGSAVTLYFCHCKIQQEPEKWNWSSILYAVGLKNVMSLREEIESICGYMPWAWGFGMKHFIPQVILILFINLASSDNGSGKPLFGNYAGYVKVPFQMLGILFVCFSFITVVVGVVAPGLFEPFDLTTIEIEAAKDVKNNGSEGSEDDEVDA